MLRTSYISLLSYLALAVCQRLHQGLWVPPELRAELLMIWGDILKHASESSRLHGCERIRLPENVLGAYETSSNFLQDVSHLLVKWPFAQDEAR